MKVEASVRLNHWILDTMLWRYSIISFARLGTWYLSLTTSIAGFFGDIFTYLDYKPGSIS